MRFSMSTRGFDPENTILSPLMLTEHLVAANFRLRTFEYFAVFISTWYLTLRSVVFKLHAGISRSA